MTITELARRVPLIKNANGKTAMDHRSPQWRQYRAALSAKGRVVREAELGVKIRDAATSVIADCEAYLQDLYDSATTVQ